MKNPTSLADLRRQGRMKMVGFLGILVIAGILASIPGKQATDNITPEVKPVMSENDAMALCQSRTRAAARFPSSVNFSMFGAAVQTLNDGAVLVRLDFEARNGFGNVLPQRALCKFLPSGDSLFSIDDR